MRARDRAFLRTRKKEISRRTPEKSAQVPFPCDANNPVNSPEFECGATVLVTARTSFESISSFRSLPGGYDLEIDRKCREHGFVQFKRLTALEGAVPGVRILIAAMHDVEEATVTGVNRNIDHEILKKSGWRGGHAA
mgnify:FL=1